MIFSKTERLPSPVSPEPLRPKVKESPNTKKLQAKISSGFDALAAFASTELDRSKQIRRQSAGNSPENQGRRDASKSPIGAGGRSPHVPQVGSPDGTQEAYKNQKKGVSVTFSGDDATKRGATPMIALTSQIGTNAPSQNNATSLNHANVQSSLNAAEGVRFGETKHHLIEDIVEDDDDIHIDVEEMDSMHELLKPRTPGWRRMADEEALHYVDEEKEEEIFRQQDKPNIPVVKAATNINKTDSLITPPAQSRHQQSTVVSIASTRGSASSQTPMANRPSVTAAPSQVPNYNQANTASLCAVSTAQHHPASGLVGSISGQGVPPPTPSYIAATKQFVTANSLPTKTSHGITRSIANHPSPMQMTCTSPTMPVGSRSVKASTSSVSQTSVAISVTNSIVEVSPADQFHKKFSRKEGRKFGKLWLQHQLNDPKINTSSLTHGKSMDSGVGSGGADHQHMDHKWKRQHLHSSFNMHLNLTPKSSGSYQHQTAASMQYASNAAKLPRSIQSQHSGYTVTSANQKLSHPQLTGDGTMGNQQYAPNWEGKFAVENSNISPLGSSCQRSSRQDTRVGYQVGVTTPYIELKSQHQRNGPSTHGSLPSGQYKGAGDASLTSKGKHMAVYEPEEVSSTMKSCSQNNATASYLNNASLFSNNPHYSNSLQQPAQQTTYNHIQSLPNRGVSLPTARFNTPSPTSPNHFRPPYPSPPATHQNRMMSQGSTPPLASPTEQPPPPPPPPPRNDKTTPPPPPPGRPLPPRVNTMRPGMAISPGFSMLTQYAIPARPEMGMPTYLHSTYPHPHPQANLSGFTAPTATPGYIMQYGTTPR